MHTVRGAVAGDLDALVRSTLGNALDSEGIELDVATVRAGVKSLLADAAKGRVFVAEESGRVVGSLYVTFEWSDWHDAWYWWIQSVFVAREHRGTGVYSALHLAVRQAAAAAENVRSIRLYVEKGNEAALRAYRRLGMSETHYVVFEEVVAGKRAGGLSAG
jgi:RimJ/RimL family protein N-acetyltransferase